MRSEHGQAWYVSWSGDRQDHITLPDGQVDEIRRRVAANESASISGFIQQAVQKSVENDAEFRAMMDQALLETGGPLTRRERAWARKMIARQGRERGNGLHLENEPQRVVQTELHG